MATILEKRYHNILATSNVNSLHEYFNIQNAEIRLTDMNTVEINFTKTKNASVIEFIRRTRIKRLNQDVIDIIISYIPNRLFLAMKFHIEYPPLYPFRPPEWSLKTVLSNIINKDLSATPENYCTYIINKHNNQYNQNWTPAVQITSDILNIFLQFNHFDILTQCYE